VRKRAASIQVRTPRMTINRREFIQGAGLVAGVAAAAVLDAIPAEAGDLTVARVQVTAVVNGQPRRMTVEPRSTLLDALREQLHLTGTKKGCDRGECGACTVLVEGRRVLSCMSLAVMQEGKRITTIEGLQRDGKLHPLQAAFIQHDGFQCGFCTSGQIMSGVGLLEEARAGWPSAATADVTKPFTLADLTGAEIRERMSGNLCRCACYPNIVAAVSTAAAEV
jgi:xanthine dehydrogenase YagT iron-sulfur-binding subunit